MQQVISLKNWSRSYQRLLFDVTTGKVVEPDPVAPTDAEPFRGFVERCVRGHMAVYLGPRSELILQWGPHKWDLLTHDCEFIYALRAGFIEEIQIRCGDTRHRIWRTMFTLKALALVDPTHDQLEADSEDFLRWVAHRATDPVAALGIRNVWINRPWEDWDEE